MAIVFFCDHSNFYQGLNKGNYGILGLVTTALLFAVAVAKVGCRTGLSDSINRICITIVGRKV